MLSPYEANHPAWDRLKHRLIGVVEGSIIFYLIQFILHDSLNFILGSLGGVCLGLCTHYRRQTLFNSLGALLAASAIYSVSTALFLRIVNTLIGLLFALLILFLEKAIVKEN